MTIRDLMNERARIKAEMDGLIEKGKKEGRSVMNTEEAAKFDELFAKQEEIRAQIDRLNKAAEIQKSLDAAPGQEGSKEDRGSQSGKPGKEEETRTFEKYLRFGASALQSQQEQRVLQAWSDPDGGFLVPPEQFVNKLLKFVDDMVFVRQAATKLTLSSGQSLGVPSLETDPADPDWTSELATGTEDTAMKFGKRSLTPSPLAKRVKVSATLLRMSSMNVDTLVTQRLAYKFAIAQEKAFLTGNGANQPLGLFTASNFGISTSRDVSTGNLTTSPTFDGLLEAKYKLKQNYWNNAKWLFHRDVVKTIAKLKDGEGQYIWQQAKTQGEPDLLLGAPLMMSEYAPNTLTTGLYVGLFGDFSFYWIADALDMQIQRLVELYAEANQVGFIGRMESDGMPALEEAFARVKLA